MATQQCFALPPTYAWPQTESTNGVSPYILHLEKPHNRIRQINENILDTRDILSLDQAKQLEMYKKLYLISHEKCQRLEARLVQKNYLWNWLRERLAYYKNKK